MRVIVLLSVAVSSFVLETARPLAQVPDLTLLKLGLAREYGLNRGAAKFKVTIEERAAEAFGLEGRGTFFMDYSWTGSNRWAISVVDESGATMDSMVSDGSLVRINDMLWDYQFQVDYSEDSLFDEYLQARWAYPIVSELHLFPLSFGRLQQIRNWVFIFETSLVYTPPIVSPWRTPILRYWPDGTGPVYISPEGEVERFDEEIRAFLEQFTCNVIFDPIFKSYPMQWVYPPKTFPFGAPDVDRGFLLWRDFVLVDGGVLIPKTCAAMGQIESDVEVYWTSELLVEESNFSEGLPLDFTIDREGMDYVAWPEEPEEEMTWWEYLLNLFGLR